MATIPCPHCNEPLFHVQPQAPDVNAVHIDDPRHEQDAKGHFVTCPKCKRRVDLDVESTPGHGAKIRVRR